MKKNIILLGLILFAGTSCSNDEIKDVKPAEVIDFRAAVDTRASETTTEVLDNFMVTAFDSSNEIYFSGVNFVKYGDSFKAEGEVYYYWPADKKLTFYAYAPTDLGEAVTIDQTKKKLTGYTPAADLRQQKDIIAVVQEEEYSPSGTTLEFEHILSQIEIVGKNNNKGYTYHIGGIIIGNIVSSGDYDFSTGQWERGNETATYSITNTYDIPLNNETGLKSLMLINDKVETAMLIPQQLTAYNPDTNTGGAYLSVYVRVVTSGGTQVFPETDNYGLVSVGIDTLWEPGIKYIYTLDFTTGESILGEPFKFQVESISRWTDSESIEKPEV